MFIIWRYGSRVEYECYDLLTTITSKKKVIFRDRHCNEMNELFIPPIVFEELIIGNDCFETGDRLKMGSNSFSHLKNTSRWDVERVKTRSFLVLNCNEL